MYNLQWGTRKRRICVKLDCGVDRISSLPDALLSHILSLIPTKYAVATSVLSKRWKYLWTFVSSLDFDGDWLQHPRNSNKDYEMSRFEFIHFVYRVLARLNTRCILKFRLRCGYDCCADSWMCCADSWICAAKARGVGELDLILSPRQKLPSSLFTCKTLTVLRLVHHVQFYIPTTGTGEVFPNLKILHFEHVKYKHNDSVTFPSLKVLHLYTVKYWNDESARRLFASCPVLEEVVVKRDRPDGVLSFIISTPTLLCLDIYFSFYHLLEGSKLQINAPALQYLNLLDYVSEDLLVGKFTSLLKANVDVYFCNRTKWHVESSYGNAVFKLIKSLSNVKFLSLSGFTMKALSFASVFTKLGFDNLTRLEVDKVECHDWLVQIKSFLEISDNLEHLVLKKEGKICDFNHQSWWTEPLHVPKCLLLRLATVSITDIRRSNNQLELVRYILKNAKVLELMTIDTSNYRSEKKFQLIQKISMFQRGSQTCQIAFT